MHFGCKISFLYRWSIECFSLTVRSDIRWPNNSKVISLKSVHCQQWTLQQEYLIVCKMINYLTSVALIYMHKEDGALPCHACTKLPLAFELHTHISEETRKPLCIHWQISERSSRAAFPVLPDHVSRNLV